MTKSLPKDITTYDLFKTVAVLLMLADHVGYYFFPDDNWWRVFGRLCVPIWFFLIGYARSRDLGPKMWGGAAILLAGNFMVGLALLPLNILASMLIVRLVLDSIMRQALRNRHNFWAMNATLLLLIIPSSMAFEYGTQGIIMAMVGYMFRHEMELGDKKNLTEQHFVFALISYVIIQFFIFAFSEPQLITMAIGTLVVMGCLFFFKPATLPRTTEILPFPLVWLLQLFGRRTLEIYVVHLMMFKIAGLFIDPERFQLFTFVLLPEAGSP